MDQHRVQKCGGLVNVWSCFETQCDRNLETLSSACLVLPIQDRIHEALPEAVCLGPLPDGDTRGSKGILDRCSSCAHNNLSRFIKFYVRFLGLSKLYRDLLVVKDGIGDRIRQARTRAGLKQSDLAQIGGIARATQVAYEAGTTEPTTTYLRKIQTSPVDVPYLLFGTQTQEFLDGVSQGSGIDWTLLQRCHEDVEFFCARFATDCPQNYRWQMVQQVYQSICAGKNQSASGQPASNALAVVQGIWNSYDEEFRQK